MRPRSPAPARLAVPSWFEDFGTARLARGRATVRLDRGFRAVVRGPYHVFLSPEGDCRGLYVGRKSSGAVEVRESQGGRWGIRFSYRIVAPGTPAGHGASASAPEVVARRRREGWPLTPPPLGTKAMGLLDHRHALRPRLWTSRQHSSKAARAACRRVLALDEKAGDEARPRARSLPGQLAQARLGHGRVLVLAENVLECLYPVAEALRGVTHGRGSQLRRIASALGLDPDHVEFRCELSTVTAA